MQFKIPPEKRSDTSAIPRLQNTQSRLLMLAALFLGLFALSISLSPAARARSWSVGYRWEHWAGYLVWLVGFSIAHVQTRRRLPGHDPYILPLVALVSGWGLLTVWRLTPYFGMRQTIWLAVALTLFVLGTRLPPNLNFLRRYKYIWLTGGLLLTAFTLIFGTNPMGAGPRLWLGCCGIYLQPSEPLKLLLIIFLAAYFADWQAVLAARSENQKSAAGGLIPFHLQILIPTLIMTGIALLLLLVQRDLGTASIFIFIYSVMVYLATGWRWIPLISALSLAAAGLVGYVVFDVIRLRVEAWINPWLDPAGRSYQIVQSLIAFANGGLFGRGPGLGSPSLVPVAHSDFVFAAVGEELGLLGGMGLLLVLGLFLHRGLRIALQTRGFFRRLLAGGLTAFIAGQSVLIIGGNLRLLPLTGVTLPFVSYGGSSLVISTIVALLLVLISTPAEEDILPLWSRQSQGLESSPVRSSPIDRLAALLLLALLAAALVLGWWTIYRAPALVTRTDNPRRAIADRYVRRGALQTPQDQALAVSTGASGEIIRNYPYPDLGPVIGYSHPVYGQSGLEASLDSYLRGVEGSDPVTAWQHHLLYGQPPPGHDIRLTLNMDLQKLADNLLHDARGGAFGALILLNATSGEILVMASHPTYDANQLENIWDDLITDPDAPLLNRATQGLYPTGAFAQLMFMQAAASPDVEQLTLRLPLADSDLPEEATPLEAAYAAAAITNSGLRPAARITLSYDHDDHGWIILPALGDPVELMSSEQAAALADDLVAPDLEAWEINLTPEDEALHWYLAGSLPGDVPALTLVLVLETGDVEQAQAIGRAVLQAAGIRKR